MAVATTEEIKTGLIYESPEVKERLKEALAFAIEIGKFGQLNDILYRFNDPGSALNPKRVRLFPDFAPYSFYFVLERLDVRFNERKDGVETVWETIYNGGIIYHGPLPDASRPETFAVVLSDEDGWSVHT